MCQLAVCKATRPLTLQLNIRKLLEDAGLPAINIVCQKVWGGGMCGRWGVPGGQPIAPAPVNTAIPTSLAQVGTEGVTRFEDRSRLPLGLSVNMK